MDPHPPPDRTRVHQDPLARRTGGPAHGVPGGRLPQHLRVLGGPRGDLPHRRRAVPPPVRLLPDRHRPADRQVPASTLQGRRTISESTALGSGISGSTTWCAAIDQLGLERAGALDCTDTARVRRGDVIDNRWAGHVSIASSARERLAAPGLMPLVSGGTANNPGCASSWSRWACSSASLVAVRTMLRSLSRAAKAT